MKTLQTDILVVGAGLAGTLFALELAKKRGDLQILLLSKKDKNQSASFLAQGGIAAALPGAADSMKRHLADTLEAGAHRCNKAVAAWFISRAPDAIRSLEEWGTAFDARPDGSRALALEGGHSTHRVLHHKDSTGRHILEKLQAALPHYPNIRLLEDAQVLKLLQDPTSKAVQGALGWDAKAEQGLSIQARAVVLATGGLGSLYAYSTNPATATGEGVYLAAGAGAEVKDLAFIQFHPTALWQPSGNRLSLISEALRGAGAVLRNEQGERFMENRHPGRELAPRDILARCISEEIRNQQKPYVYLDATALPDQAWNSHFPGIWQLCRQAGIDPQREWIPVVPAAHYSCGGIATSVKGFTSVKQLYVIGETACTGLHGANRLASNSLLEATLMATSLATEIAREELPSPAPMPTAEWIISQPQAVEGLADSLMEEIRLTVQKGCGLIKTKQGLQQAHQQLLELKVRMLGSLPENCLQAKQLQMALQTALMLTKASIEQTENKGVFFNLDLEKEMAEL